MHFKQAIFLLLFSNLLVAEEPCPIFYGNPVDPCPSAFRLYAMGDYLYWQASESNFEYAMKQKSSSLGATTSVSEIDYPFKAAFRLGAGVVFPNYDWQLEANWTQFVHHVHNSQMQVLGGAPALIALWMRPEGGFLSWERAAFFWNFKFNTVDFDLLREGFTNANFLFAPRIGLKRGWIKQHLHVRYDGGANAFYDVSYNNDFRGLGVRIGFDTRLIAKWGFSLMASGGTALLYGSFDLNRIDVTSLVGDTGINLTEMIHRFSPMVQGLVALEWGRCFSPNSCKISLALGFEGQVWFRQNHLRTFVSTALPSSNFKTNGNLTLQGLTLHARLDF